jgi:hypothetical protein
MGGLNGEIRGKSKIEVYLKYKEQVEKREATFEDQHPDPKFKKLCKSLMFQDPSTGEWVLNYHLHT